MLKKLSSIVILMALIVIALSNQPEDDKSCGKNTVPVPEGYCVDYCPPSCVYPQGPEACPRICIQNGCNCEPGFLRKTENRSSDCICPADCPKDH